MTRVLLALDKFKDALTAKEACDAVASALHALHPTWEIEQTPLTDGGEGFVSILTNAVAGRYVIRDATGPCGERRPVASGLVAVKALPAGVRSMLQCSNEVSSEEIVAIVEMAAASGLALVPPQLRNPWRTMSTGTGQLLRASKENGAKIILLGVGGSATHDLGLGALAALGLTFVDAAGIPVDPPIPARWAEIVAITGAIPPDFPAVFIACDVNNPLLGTRGAAAIYGAQKGLQLEDCAQLEAQTERMADLLCRFFHRSAELKNTHGAGAAGGIAFGLMTALNARILPGFSLVCTWMDLEAKLAAADIVVTGEGRFDASSLEGKGPGAVATRALELGKSVHVFAGQIALEPNPRLHLHSITGPGIPLAEALAHAGRNLTTTASVVFAHVR